MSSLTRGPSLAGAGAGIWGRRGGMTSLLWFAHAPARSARSLKPPPRNVFRLKGVARSPGCDGARSRFSFARKGERDGPPRFPDKNRDGGPIGKRLLPCTGTEYGPRDAVFVCKTGGWGPPPKVRFNFRRLKSSHSNL